MLGGPYINQGTPVPVTIALQLENDVWIVGVKDNGFLKMVKLRVTGPNSFVWIETKYTPDGSYDNSCLTSFQESCFAGTDNVSGFYTVDLAAINQIKTLRFL